MLRIIDAGFECFGLHDPGNDPAVRTCKIIDAAGRTCYGAAAAEG